MESKMSENLDMEDEEVNFVHTSRTAEDEEFDQVVGQLEQILMDETFTKMQNDYCEKHCAIFEDCKENKLEYTSIFERYTSLVESFIENKLKENLPGFTMAKLETIIVNRQDELGGEVFELLTSLGDFAEFKDLMISYKNSKQQQQQSAASNSSSSSSSNNEPTGFGLDFAISGKKV